MTTIKDITHFQFYKKLTSLPFVNQIWLFGSRARNDHQERADIDLAIVCPCATAIDWFTVEAIIDEADTLLKIDCVRLDELEEESALKQSIKQQGLLLYEKLQNNPEF